MHDEEPLRWPSKDPTDRVDMSFDWADILRVMGDADTIVTATWTLPLELTEEKRGQTSSETIIWVSGGTAGKDYMISCQIVTAAGRRFERSAWLPVRNK